jgi:hypothetical protein
MRLQKGKGCELPGKEKAPLRWGLLLCLSRVGGVLSRQSNSKARKIIVDWNEIRQYWDTRSVNFEDSPKFHKAPLG